MLLPAPAPAPRDCATAHPPTRYGLTACYCHLQLMKIDVEGDEGAVLEGAADLLVRRNIWFICLEFSVPLIGPIRAGGGGSHIHTHTGGGVTHVDTWG